MTNVGGSFKTNETLTVTKPRQLWWALVIGVVLFTLLLVAMTSVQLHDGVNVAGHLESVNGLSKMYARSGGEVAKVVVQEGEHVRKGRLLYVLRISQSSAQNPDVQTTILEKLGEKQQLLEKKLVVLHEQETPHFRYPAFLGFYELSFQSPLDIGNQSPHQRP